MIFVRFSKRCGDASKDGNKSKSYRRAVRIDNSIIVQDGDTTVAYAYLLKDSKNTYAIFVQPSDKEQEYIAYTKRFIGNSAKWCHLNEKKRKYVVTTLNLQFFKFYISAETI